MHETGSNILGLEKSNIWCHFTHRNTSPLFFDNSLSKNMDTWTIPAHTLTATLLFTLSGRPDASWSSIYGFFLILLRSSCRPSKRNVSSSCESCCWYPKNCGANLPTWSYRSIYTYETNITVHIETLTADTKWSLQKQTLIQVTVHETGLNTFI
jgi:hypothetical protein